MRSFTSCQATDMHQLFWFSLLLTHLPVTGSIGTADGCLTQPREDIWSKTGQEVVLSCNVSSGCPATNLHYEWFVFKKDSYRLNLHNNVKYSLEGASLHIHSLDTSDSGIYHCAAVWPGQPTNGAQHVGAGTTLIVKGKPAEWNILLWLSFVLLFIYSMAVVTLLILKKHGYNMRSSKRTCKSGKNLPSKKTQFRDVLQEMNNRRNLKRHKQSSGRNPSQVEAASPELNSSTDDVYQNV